MLFQSLHVVREILLLQKNVDPYAESAIVNGASKYSYACSAVKYNPNGTVKNNP